MKVDKIRVLLIDDEPFGLSRRRAHGERPFYLPSFGPEAGKAEALPGIQELFDLRWLARIEEAREYRDLSSLIAVKNPTALGEDGWVPDLLCFDYMMTGGSWKVSEAELPEELAREISPLPDLRELAERNGVRYTKAGPPPLDSFGGNDSFGCYCGGMIFTLFYDHFCAPVALTRKTDVTAGTDAGFFEWFLELDGGDAFRRKGKPSLSWESLLKEGVARLRDRIVELIKGNLVDLDLETLMALSAGEDRESLIVHNRFGVRDLPIAGLFSDYSESLRRDMVRAWATQCLETLFEGVRSHGQSHSSGASTPNKSLADFEMAREFSSELFEAYLSERSKARYRLSKLALDFKQGDLSAKEAAEISSLCNRFGVDQARLRLSVLVSRTKQGIGDLSTTEEAELEGLCRQFGVKVERIMDSKSSYSPPDPSCEHFFDLRKRNMSRRAIRWTVLLVAVRLELLAIKCREAWRHHHRERGLERLTSLPLAPIDDNDVFLALFPVPKNPLVTGFHDEGSVSSSWNVLLNPKNGTPKDFPKLSLKNLLSRSEKSQDEKGGHADANELIPGEARVLRWFAYSEAMFRESLVDEIEWLRGRD